MSNDEYNNRLMRSLEIIDKMNSLRVKAPQPVRVLRPLMHDEYIFRRGIRQEREDFNEQRDRVMREP